MEKSGRLFVVATPIGNLNDITFRAVETLKSADFILCEDTRISGRLLKHYEIKTPLVVFGARDEERKINAVLKRIAEGENCALISDAGTPAISDPGVRLVNACIGAGIEVTGAPGASAVIYALSVSGVPTDSFLFEGFLPQKKGRQKKLKEIAQEHRTVVIYESVYRIKKLLTELNEYCPNRFIAVARELTKMYEEILRGTSEELLSLIDEKNTKGEFVVILAPLNWEIRE